MRHSYVNSVATMMMMLMGMSKILSFQIKFRLFGIFGNNVPRMKNSRNVSQTAQRDVNKGYKLEGPSNRPNTLSITYNQHYKIRP
jgi:hypothetical protein